MVRVRPAELRDLDALVAGNLSLAAETERLQLDPPTLREGILALLAGRAPGRYWVAELDSRVVGQLLVTYEWSDWRNRMVWWIQSVYVVPGATKSGLYRADDTWQEAAKDFAQGYVLTSGNFTPESAPQAFATALRYLAPGALSTARATLEADLARTLAETFREAREMLA